MKQEFTLFEFIDILEKVNKEWQEAETEEARELLKERSHDLFLCFAYFFMTENDYDDYDEELLCMADFFIEIYDKFKDCFKKTTDRKVTYDNFIIEITDCLEFITESNCKYEITNLGNIEYKVEDFEDYDNVLYAIQFYNTLWYTFVYLFYGSTVEDSIKALEDLKVKEN